MVFTAVYKQQLRKRGETLIPVRIALEAAVDRLMHTGIVVADGHVLDAEFFIRTLERLSVNMHRHCGDNARVAEV